MSKSEQLYQAAIAHIPGGVNSPVRNFSAVGGHPLYFKKGSGAYLYDEDDKAYIDYVCSWGPLILGHNHPEVIKAAKQAIDQGMTFGACNHYEVELANLVCELMPNIEKVRMVNSGTEATMSAIRLARGFTGRDKFIKFQGCYHGHSDALLVKAGSGALTFGQPSSPGVPASFTQHTLVADFNDLDSVQKLFEQHGDDIAAIILEPAAGNMNFIPPEPGFLSGLRELCNQYGSILIFDEVMTGFRIALGGAQQHYNIKPDLTCLGKVIGGGMPVGAFGGRADIMNMLSPEGPVYQAGTLSGNPVAMAAGLANLKQLTAPGLYDSLSNKAQQLCQGIETIANDAGIAVTTNQVGAMFGIFFTDEKVSGYEQVMNCNKEHFNQFFQGMLDKGIYLPPSSFEAIFLSSAHQDEEINQTLNAAEQVFKSMTKQTAQ